MYLFNMILKTTIHKKMLHTTMHVQGAEAKKILKYSFENLKCNQQRNKEGEN